MNILLLVNELRSTCGVTNHILHLSRGLVQTGNVNLWIICGGGNGINRFSDINVNIISDERFLHLTRTFSGYISAINFLVKFTRQNEIDVLHSHYHYGAAIARRASQFTSGRTVQTNHGILEAIGRLKHFNADKYAAINEHIVKYIIENKIANESNIAFIRCGIPVPDKMPEKPVRDKIKVLAASRFTHEKGLDLFINAVNLLPEEILERASFYIAGEGELESKLKEQNAATGSKVIFPGKVPDMNSYLESVHVLVNPTRSDNEGFPAIITEAGAANALVISSDFRGSEDILDSGNNCLKFKSGSAAELAVLLDKVLTDYERYKLLSENFYKLVKKEYSISTMIEKHISLYQNCLKK
ncbi:MAG: glycosyltransferase family 4 protein [Ignavibacteria bacterium]|nr:glycosyltransferase family 4 protein [Ignavibacteria bacterium]